MASNPPSTIFLGKIGVGKTTVFNKLCDADRCTDMCSYSVTRTYARNKIFYQGKELVILDGPGCKSKRDTYNHSYVMRHGLTHEPLNAIFVFVEYNCRIGSNMADDYWEVVKMLKHEYLPMVVMVVTKMDQFQPEGSHQSQEAIQQHIREVFAKDFDVNNIVFTERNIEKQDLFISMHDAVKSMPPIKLEYSEVEFLQYFELKAWKGREMHDLYRMKNLIQELTSGFLEGLGDLEKHRNEYSDQEFQDYVFSAIQQSNYDLEEKVTNPFMASNAASELEFEDYAAFIELRKLVLSAHNEVRNEAKSMLPINPDDTSDWRNAIRRCQHCREVWVKVEGCDGETTCGAIPSDGDPYGTDSYFACTWAKVEGVLRPRKVNRRKNRVVREKVTETRIGCGRSIDWKNQAIVPAAELDALFSTQELELILSNYIGSNNAFVAKKGKREKNIQVFSEIGKDGKDIYG